MMFAKFDPDNIPEIIQHFPMKLSGSYARCVQEWQLKDMVGDYSRPVLYMHGTADQIVSVDYARKAVKAYPQAEYHEIIGGEHMFRGKHDIEARGYIADFLRKYYVIASDYLGTT